MPNVIAKLHYYPPESNNPKISKRRSFYSSSQYDDYMAYIDKGMKRGISGLPHHSGSGDTPLRSRKNIMQKLEGKYFIDTSFF